MGVCMITPQTIYLSETKTRLEFMFVRDHAVIDVAEFVDSDPPSTITHRIMFTPAGQVASIRRLTPEDGRAKE